MSRVPLGLRKLRDDERPLAIAGVYARGAASATLIHALLALDDGELRMMRAVTTSERALVVVLGPAELLPWRDGVRYLGEAAPGLFIATTRALTVPAVAAAQALAKHVPCALLADGSRTVEARDRQRGASPRPAEEGTSPHELELVSLRSAISLSRAGIRRGVVGRDDDVEAA